MEFEKREIDGERLIRRVGYQVKEPNVCDKCGAPLQRPSRNH